MASENNCRSIGTQTEEGAAVSRGESGGSEKFQSEMKDGACSLRGSKGFF